VQTSANAVLRFAAYSTANGTLSNIQQGFGGENIPVREFVRKKYAEELSGEIDRLYY